jgi:hypothetical protein
LFLGLEARCASQELLLTRASAEQTIKALKQDNANIGALFGKLEEFARTHPDFDKVILSRYPASAYTASAAPATPAAPAAPAKK